MPDKTEQLIKIQELEQKIADMEEKLKHEQERNEAAVKANEDLRLHNQKLYAKQVVGELETEVKQEEKTISEDEIRSLWKA